MDTKKLVGMRIKNLRRGRGYSQERLAEVMGTSPKYLSSIERGVENPTLELFIRLSQGLKVDLHEIFQLENEGEQPRSLRKRLNAVATEVNDQELARAIRLLQALIH